MRTLRKVWFAFVFFWIKAFIQREDSSWVQACVCTLFNGRFWGVWWTESLRRTTLASNFDLCKEVLFCQTYDITQPCALNYLLHLKRESGQLLQVEIGITKWINLFRWELNAKKIIIFTCFFQCKSEDLSKVAKTSESIASFKSTMTPPCASLVAGRISTHSYPFSHSRSPNSGAGLAETDMD